MAGGAGSRFWPLSRNSKPKQFIDILGTGKTLLQQTFDRFAKIFPKENILIVTSSNYKDITLEQLPDIDESQVLLEPFRRNTAPCIAYANYKIFSKNKNANLIVSPADHLIINEEKFLETVKTGLDFTAKNNALLTLGIKPAYPQTGYGYIQINPDEMGIQGIESLAKVKTFTEKPDLEMAKVFLESGEFYWNSGIFIWSLNSIMKSFTDNLSEVDVLFKQGLDVYFTDKEEAFISKTYAACKNISIDYGIMERAENVFVMCADFGWSDLGTWGSLYEHSTKDNENNVITSRNAITYETKDCIVKTKEDKLVVLQGLEGYIVVEADDVLLICKREEEQEIKQIVKRVRMEKGDKYI